jgi:hypothetical protein
METRLFRVNLFIVLILVCFCIGSCTKYSVKKMPEKFDASLRMEMNKIKTSNLDSTISCLMKLEKEPQSEEKQQIEKCGLRILEVVKDIVVVEGTPASIECVSTLEFVKTISKSQTDRPTM